MSVPTPPLRPRRLLWGIVAALAVWGVYLAIGATGVFTDVGLFDGRRSVIVLACTAGFLGFWMWILFNRPASSEDTTERSPRNWPSLTSLLTVAVAYAFWAGAWAVWNSAERAQLTFALGWTSLGLFAVAAVLTLVGLSDPRRGRGKLWGLVTLVLLLLAAGGLIVQVRHFAAARQRPNPSVRVRPAVDAQNLSARNA